jgi:hypothetical protein
METSTSTKLRFVAILLVLRGNPKSEVVFELISPQKIQ